MIYFLIFIFGLAIGSFLNVVICRLETKEPILIGRSHCPKCRAVLKWLDLIPVLSFLIQKGKCRYCQKKISWQYLIVEISTGLLFIFIFNQFFTNYFNLIYYLILISFLIVIFVYDLKHYIIPDRIVFSGIVISLIYLIYIQTINSVWAGLIASGFFLSLVLVSRGKWMGLGDVKFAFLMGLILGWPNVLIALFLSFFSGAIVGIGLIIKGKKGLKSEIPFGPFLVGSTLVVMFFNQYLITLWISFFSFY